jgi:hypothetical protein
MGLEFEGQGDSTGGIPGIALRESRLAASGDGFAFRDLNKNGELDVYEDPRRPVEERVEDLLGRMTLEEKADPLFPFGFGLAY